MLRSFARAEHLIRPLLTYLPSNTAVKIFSKGRTWFAHKVADEIRSEHVPEFPAHRFWDLNFRIPIWNAAGMFKNGEGYHAMAAQGAGAWVAGTTTGLPRMGNTREGIRWPSMPYPRTKAASNWMGLPNNGHEAVASVISKLARRPLCPIGASISSDSGIPESESLPLLLRGIDVYDKAGVDFLELNESCPNVEHHHGSGLDDSLIRRLEYISQHGLKKLNRNLPVLVKFSVDTSISQIPELLDTLITLGYSGIILGNTSVRYSEHREHIHKAERKVYDYFTNVFGGGLSGSIVRKQSLDTSATAAAYVRSKNVPHEFHVIRCGGVSGVDDVRESAKAGVVIHQWYTGYFEKLSYKDFLLEYMNR